MRGLLCYLHKRGNISFFRHTVPFFQTSFSKRLCVYDGWVLYDSITNNLTAKHLLSGFSIGWNTPFPKKLFCAGIVLKKSMSGSNLSGTSRFGRIYKLNQMNMRQSIK